MPVLSAADLRTGWLQGLSGSTDDTYLDAVIARAEAQVARYLGFPSVAGAAPSMGTTTYTRYGPDGDSGIHVDGRNLYLEPRPVTAVTGVYDDLNEEWGSDSLVAAADYTVHPWGIRLHPTASHAEWSTDQRAIKIAFAAGWSTYPADLVQAVGMLSRHYILLRDRQGYASLPTAAGSAALRDETIPDAVRALLDPMRMPSVLL